MTKPVELRIVIDDEGARILKETGSELDQVGRKSKKTTSTMQQGFERVVGRLKKMRDAVFGLKGALAGLGIALSIAGFVKLGQSLIAPSRMVESMTISFGVLAGSMSVAKQRLAELTQFARTTPFELPEVFQAARMLRVFGLDTSANLRLVGDAAAAVQTPIEELALWFGRLASGEFGRSLERFRELGVVTREQLEARGLKFDRNGALQATTREAMNAVAAHVRDSFGGMMDAQSGTLNGMISNFQDFVFQAKLKLAEPLFRIVKSSMEQILVQADRLSQSGKLEEWGEKIADAAGKALLWFGYAVDFIRNEVIPAIRSAWDWLSKLPEAIREFDMQSFGETLGEHIANGFKKAFSVSAALLGAGGGMSQGPQLVGQGVAPQLVLRPNQGTPGSAAVGPAVIAEGLDRSNLAGAIQRLLADARSPVPPPAGPTGGSTEAGQRSLLANGFATVDYRLGGMSAPGNQRALGMGVPPGAGGLGPVPDVSQFQTFDTDALAKSVEESRNLYQQMVDDALANLSHIQQGWMDFRLGTLDIVGGWFEDLADSTMTGTERFNALVDNMKRLALRSIWGIASGWLKARIMQSTGEAIVQQALTTTAAVSASAGAAEVATSTAVTSAKAQEATAKAAASYGWIPFVGAAALAAFVVLLGNSLNKFESGGMVRGGSGTHDDVPALLVAGEGVVNRRGMQRIGKAGLDAINSGGDIGGGGDVFAPQIVLPSNGLMTRADLEAAIQTTLVPALEDLWERRRLNLSGSRLRGR